MTKKENVKPYVRWKNFWRQNDRFADLFNAVLFHGEEVLKPEALEEIDTDMSGIVQFKDYEESLVPEMSKKISVWHRIRDFWPGIPAKDSLCNAPSDIVV